MPRNSKDIQYNIKHDKDLDSYLKGDVTKEMRAAVDEQIRLRNYRSMAQFVRIAAMWELDRRGIKLDPVENV